MSNKDTGGPAFPTMQYEHGGDEDGMSMRDYFAAKALQSHILIDDVFAAISKGQVDPQTICEACYMWADVMLKARKK